MKPKRVFVKVLKKPTSKPQSKKMPANVAWIILTKSNIVYLSFVEICLDICIYLKK